MKRMFVDVGELGWSLYLSAHVRWFKQNTEDYIGVTTFADRRCLYNGIADAIYNVPDDFHGRFNRDLAIYFGLRGVTEGGLRDYFATHSPNGYKLEGPFGRWKGFRGMTVFKPYAYSKRLNGKKEILIFPRYREGAKFSHRNLSEGFYVTLINALCDKFPDFNVRTVGLIPGSYSMNIDKENYIDSVSEHSDLQDLIDFCQVAICTIGGTSAPPKIALLQGVPTFVVGHERVRFMATENWMSTKVGFYDVPKKNYVSIDVKACVDNIISFVGGC